MVISLIQQKFHGTKEATIARTLELLREAEGELVLLQELHQTQYFCKSEDPAYFQLAEEFQQDLSRWQQVSRQFRKVLVVSLFEKGLEGVYYNTAVVLDRGEIAGFYRKTHIPDDPGFYEKFYFTPGDRIEPIDTSVGRLGVLICWDQWYPEPARILGLKGAELLLYPTAIGWLRCPTDRVDPLCEEEQDPAEEQKMLEAWLGVQRGHAIANGLPLFAANRVGFEPDPSGCLGGIQFWGHSVGFGPQGEVLGLGGEGEEVLNIELDLNRTRKVRQIWPFYRDRRVELYRDLERRSFSWLEEVVREGTPTGK